MGQTIAYDLPFVQSSALQNGFHNPAAKVNSSLEFSGNFHALVGSFSDVNNTLLLVNYKLKESRALGAYFTNEKTTDFFSRTRLYLAYQEQIELSRQSTLTAGIRLGAVNFVMEPVGFTSGGSDWGMDLSAGIELNSNNFKLGVVGNQLTNTTLRPILFEFELKRFFELYAQHHFDLTPKISYKPELRARLNILNDLFILSNVITYNEQYGINLSWSITEGVFFQGFVSYEGSKGHTVKVLFSFFQSIPTTLRRQNTQQIEFGLNIDLGKSEKN